MKVSNYKQMRLILIYDLPMEDELDRKVYAKFHKKLQKIGYHMLQYSVYTKVIVNDDNYKQVKKQTESIIPSKGQIIIFKLTEKQYRDMVYLRGEQNMFALIVANNDMVVFKEIEEYISKIYMWKEITKEALPTFENINNANELWLWEVIKKNLETYETTYEEIQQKGKELFGEKFEKQIPKEGNDSFYYDKESNKYLATEIVLDEEEDSFLLKDIEKEGEKYKVKIIEYIEDYSEENKVIIRNLQEEEIGRVSTSDSETKIKEIVKNNKERFSQKNIEIKKEKDNLVIEKVNKE